ncbi:hypothetical protein [Cerasicoccus maritimus]|uniref:hypothetical protein n=1 Tax=Cerasicoccus maritimus TaxID=490089 RepID=UPI002852C95E|nr:hypothetical protein [Cerasicoccus maritimus]
MKTTPHTLRQLLSLLGLLVCYSSLSLHAENDPLVSVDLAILMLEQQNQPKYNAPFSTEVNAQSHSEDAERYKRWVRTSSNPDNFQQVVADENLLSLPFAYHGPRQFTLYERVNQPGEKTTFIPRERLLLPSNSTSGVLVLTRDQRTSESSPFKIGFIDCSEADQNSMGVLFCNYSDAPKAVRIGKNSSPITINPSARSWTPLHQDRAVTPLKIASFDGQWKLVQNTVVRLSPHRPTLGVILPGDQDSSKSIRLLRFTLPNWKSTTPNA